MKKEFFASVILLAIFIGCSAWYRKAPSSSIPMQKQNTQKHCDAGAR